MVNKIAIITGVSGQDGSYLSKLLLKKNYKVIGIERYNSQNQRWRHKFLNIEGKITYKSSDLNDELSIRNLIKKYKPNEIYNLASHSFVKSSFENPLNVIDTNAKSVVRILELIKEISPKTKFYQASSSEMFGGNSNKNLSLSSHFNPKSPYAYSKLMAHFATKNYRDAFGLFACSGVLFNHESVLRGNEYVTKKIIQSLVKYKFDSKNFKILKLGNLYAKRDWGSAEEYVYGMWKILQMRKPDDYIIGTGYIISVKDFINFSLDYLDIHNYYWKGKGLNEKLICKDKIIISIEQKFFRKIEVNRSKCDMNETYKKLKWKPKIYFKKLIKKLIDDEKSLQNLI